MATYSTAGGTYSLQEGQGHTAVVHSLADSLSQHHGMPSGSPYYTDAPHQHHQAHQPPPRPPPQHYDGGANGHGQGPDSQLATPEGQTKGNRLRKACDSCSIRKVKCDESGPPCKACAALDIPCTFERPSRRRGPPNRHAEAIKRRRIESPTAPGGFSSPTSPSNVAATLASFSSHAVLSAESICPFSTLELLVDDFFTYIHPLCPFPHEPSFRAAFKHREDLNNPSFLALLASMMGALVASFPRKPRLHLKAQHRENLFPNSITLVERCHKVAVEARGAGYLDKELSVYDAATSYFLGLAAAYTFKWKQCRLYFGETLTISRSIGIHRVKDPSYYNVGSWPMVMGQDGPPLEGRVGDTVDYIRQEIGRRIYWVMFIGVRSMQQLGASYPELQILPPTASDPYPPLPMEVDDEYIYVSHVDPQPAGVMSRLTGFNLNVQIYKQLTQLATMELYYGVDEIFDLNRQKRLLEDCLLAVKRTLEHIPLELMLSPGSQPGEFQNQSDRVYYPPTQDFPGARGGTGNPLVQADIETHPEARRLLQFEIQKANIYASQLGTRSYIIEKYWNILDAYDKRMRSREDTSSPIAQQSPLASGIDGLFRPSSSTSAYEMVETHMNSEREDIVTDLLKVLGSISQVNMEPNGGSFINKIRQIASTLLDTPRNRKGPLALRAEEYLARFLEVLMKLERISPPLKIEPDIGSDDRESAEQQRIWSNEASEEEELRNWADLREFQERFMRSGGFFDL